MSLADTTKIHVLAPVVRERKGEYKKLLADMLAEGFTRARIDGEVVSLEDIESIELGRYNKHNIDIVVDRIVIKEGIEEMAVEKQRMPQAMQQFIDPMIKMLKSMRFTPEGKTMTGGMKIDPKVGVSMPMLMFNARARAIEAHRAAVEAADAAGDAVEEAAEEPADAPF